MASRKTKKNTRKVSHSSTVSKSIIAPIVNQFSPAKLSLEKFKQNKFLSIAVLLGIVILFLLAFPFRYLLVPAIVNGQPIFSWQYLAEMHKKSGAQVLNQMISEKLIEQEIAKQGIQTAQAEIDQEINKIEAQIGTESGGLDAMLSFQGLTRNEFVHQLRLNLALEKMIKGTITISDEDVNTELKNNAVSYKNMTQPEAAAKAAESIRSEKMQSTFTTWFQELRAKAKIKNFLFAPSVSLPSSK